MSEQDVRVLLALDDELELRAMLETSIEALGAEYLEWRNKPGTKAKPSSTVWDERSRCSALETLIAGETLYGSVCRAQVVCGGTSSPGKGCTVATVQMGDLNKARGLLKNALDRSVKDKTLKTHSERWDAQCRVLHLLAVAMVATAEPRIGPEAPHA